MDYYTANTTLLLLNQQNISMLFSISLKNKKWKSNALEEKSNKSTDFFLWCEAYWKTSIKSWCFHSPFPTFINKIHRFTVYFQKMQKDIFQDVF